MSSPFFLKKAMGIGNYMIPIEINSELLYNNFITKLYIL